MKKISICLAHKPMHFFNCSHLSMAQVFLVWVFLCACSFMGKEGLLEFNSRLRGLNLLCFFLIILNNATDYLFS